MNQAARLAWNPDTAWRRFCGFLDLSRDGFRDIQDRLLQEQIDLMSGTSLGRRLMPAGPSRTVGEFRSAVPLTTYADYSDALNARASGELAQRSYTWTRTVVGPGDEKWIPYSARALDRFLDSVMAGLLLAAARRPGDVMIGPRDVVMFNVPPRPYLSGLAAFGIRDRFGFRGVLEPEAAEAMDFKDRITASFERALHTGVDVIISMTSVLLKTGQRLEGERVERRGERKSRFGRWSAPTVGRLARARLKSALVRRPIRPRDLWRAKAIVGWGLDTGLFRDEVEAYWGRPPHELYASTEGGMMAVQAPGERGLVFVPYSDFYEFIPESELELERADADHRPRTVLVDELRPGVTYEVVITNFYGMPLMRYRQGHLIKVLSAAAGLPRFEFVGRSDDYVDIAGFTRIDERTVWKALRAVSVTCPDWTIRREASDGKLQLHLYGEFTGVDGQDDLGARIHESLRQVDPLYRDLDEMLDIHPLRVTQLPAGSFDRFYESRRRDGQSLLLRRPARINPGDREIADLLAAAGPVEGLIELAA